MDREMAGEASFEYEGRRYTLVLSWSAIQSFETETGTSLIDMFMQIKDPAGPLGSPKLMHLAMLVRAMLSDHHPEVTGEMALKMWGSDVVQNALGLSASRGLPQSGGEAGGDARPSKPRASGKNGTSNDFSKTGSKRGAAKRDSGARRRG